MQEAPVWVFDVDGTVWDDRLAKRKFDGLVDDFIMHHAGMSRQALADTRKRLQLSLGVSDVSSKELVRALDLSYTDMLEVTFGRLPLRLWIQEEPALRTLLKALPGRKISWTNSPRNHGINVLRLLGIDTCFEAILGNEQCHPFLKPDVQAFERIAEQINASRIIFIDNTPQCVETANSFGWTGYWLKNPWVADDRWPHLRSIPSLHELPSLRF